MAKMDEGKTRSFNPMSRKRKYAHRTCCELVRLSISSKAFGVFRNVFSRVRLISSFEVKYLRNWVLP
jgi:hypothetical protein